MTAEVLLREVSEDDLSIFFGHQQDPAANQMAAFTARDKEAFYSHWTRILADESVVTRTILLDGEVAGNVVSFEAAGRREVGYWIGREYWGRGIATKALSLFLGDETTRPLFACVAKHNAGSIRVLEKCGFKISGYGKGADHTGTYEVEEVILELSENAGESGG
jgi:RimJ/RimL family protein N-acetyltransferase